LVRLFGSGPASATIWEVVLVCGCGQQGGALSGVAPAGQDVPSPESMGEALAMISAGIAWLADADVASAPAAAQAECLRGLERARSAQTVAQARVLGAFDAGLGFEGDACRSPRTWLMWQTQVTGACASAAVAWVRRLRVHPAVRDALRAGTISESWARQICDWTDDLPDTARGDADEILLRAAAAGAGLGDLAKLVEEILAMLAQPSTDDRPPGFDDRQVRLSTTMGGVGKLDGDLTGQCAAALQSVLDALGKKMGPEDGRTAGQRRHDALAEACRRLIAAENLPDRAGQPTRIQLHLTLEDLLRRIGGPAQDTAAWPSWEQRMWPPLDPAAPVPGPAPGWPVAAPGEECDAVIAPIVTGCLDQDLLDRLTAQLTGPGRPGDLTADGTPKVVLSAQSVRDLIVANAAALFCGPRGLASWLRRTTLDGPAATRSLPLDTGAATETIPAHLRRAVIVRDQHCAAPGCTMPPAGCQVHHLTPRSRGGRTKLSNLILLCSFHHLIAVHIWGWTISLNADGTTTMTSPDKSRTYHSHSPPAAA
jgi:hypothetical protein